MTEEYSIYSAFDLDKHKETYTDYLETIILPDGTIEYAVPSHCEKMAAVACEKLGLTRQELNDMCPKEYYWDFILWLSKVSGCCAVWNDSVVGFTFSSKQISALRKLKMHGVYKGKIPDTTAQTP